MAVIYGSMPSTIKLLQQEKFNNPNHPCKILVATDAIGMGLNLNIRRIIFTEITKHQSKIDKNGVSTKEREELSTSQALQIAGRAGRYKTEFSDGKVTTLNPEDCKLIQKFLN